jgi:hypothetical protein
LSPENFAQQSIINHLDLNGLGSFLCNVRNNYATLKYEMFFQQTTYGRLYNINALPAVNKQMR